MRFSPLHFALAVALATGAACQTPLPRGEREESRRQNGAAYLAHPIVVGQLVFHADFMLPENHRLLGELAAERDSIVELLKLPPSETPIHVHLFGEETTYRQHVSREYPGFPERRAIFVESDGRLAVYAHWSDSIAEDLRHEVAHGYLHASIRNLPLWLDEGLAEYFEVVRGRNGVHQLHVDYLKGQLAVGNWQPNLARLEQLSAAQELTQLDYAESWLWVHWMLQASQSDGDLSTVLTGYLADLAANNSKTVVPLAERLKSAVASPELRLIEHLRSLAR